MPRYERPKCDFIVFTYHARGTHRCYLNAKTVMDGLKLCTIHAKVQARRHKYTAAGREVAA